MHAPEVMIALIAAVSLVPQLAVFCVKGVFGMLLANATSLLLVKLEIVERNTCAPCGTEVVAIPPEVVAERFDRFGCLKPKVPVPATETCHVPLKLTSGVTPETLTHWFTVYEAEPEVTMVETPEVRDADVIVLESGVGGASTSQVLVRVGVPPGQFVEPGARTSVPLAEPGTPPGASNAM